VKSDSQPVKEEEGGSTTGVAGGHLNGGGLGPVERLRRYARLRSRFVNKMNAKM